MTETNTGAILASLAAAAGALAAGAPAQASIVTTTINQTVGFSGGSASPAYTLMAAGTSVGSIFATSFAAKRLAPRAASLTQFVGVGTASSNYFKTIKKPAGSRTFTVPVGAPPGATWDTSTNATSTNSFGIFLVQNGGNEQITPVPSGEQYYLFQFQAGSQTDYGWLSGTLFDNGPGNFGINLDQFAYQPDGTQIAAGDTGASVPEPASAALLAFGALVTGAAGTRRFKRARLAA